MKDEQSKEEYWLVECGEGPRDPKRVVEGYSLPTYLRGFSGPDGPCRHVVRYLGWHGSLESARDAADALVGEPGRCR